MTWRQGQPIVIADYDAAWPRTFQEERALLVNACDPGSFERIEHVGSTSVTGLAAKPIVDMMPGIRSLEAFAPQIEKIVSLGYDYVQEFERDTELGPGMPFRRYFRKDVNGLRAFHVHVVETGSDFWRDTLMFRNYLRVSDEDTQAYEKLKRKLAADYNATMLAKGVDINLGYTDYKTEFVESVLAKARARMARNKPIALLPYDPAWPRRFEEERARIAPALEGIAVRIEHVGSTSVPGLAAKPTIDIAIGARTMDEGRAAIEPLFALKFAHGIDNFPDWRYFDRDGQSEDDDVHLHMVPFGGARWRRYLLFRDHLRAHPGHAAAYADLKLALAEEFVRDRIGYVEAKGEFIQAILQRATTVLPGI